MYLCGTCRSRFLPVLQQKESGDEMTAVIEFSNLAYPIAGPALVCIPGWIGRGRDQVGSPSQYRPLMEGGVFNDYGTVLAMDFVGPHAPSGDIEDAMIASFERLIELHGPVTVLASSYGAMMTIGAFAAIESRSRLILVDPPAGAKSLVKLRQFKAGGLAKHIGVLPEWLNSGFPQWAFDKAFCPGLADSDPIDIPASWEGDRAEYVARVRQDAFDGQQGFPLTLCAEQIGAMARAEDLAEVAEEADRLHDIVRVVCTVNNQVVNPAVADPFYNRHMPRAMRVEVPTNHCDYLQRPELWVNALGPLL